MAAPLTYRIDRSLGLVVITYVGKIDVDEVLSKQAEMRALPEFDPDYASLFDYSAADLSEIDAVALRRIAAGTPFSSKARRAFLVRDEVSYGLLRMFQAFSEMAGRGDMVQVFLDRDEALRWLALRPVAP